MGYHAVCLLEQGKYNRIVGMKGEELVDYPVDEALEMTKSIDRSSWMSAIRSRFEFLNIAQSCISQ